MCIFLFDNNAVERYFCDSLRSSVSLSLFLSLLLAHSHSSNSHIFTRFAAKKRGRMYRKKNNYNQTRIGYSIVLAVDYHFRSLFAILFGLCVIQWQSKYTQKPEHFAFTYVLVPHMKWIYSGRQHMKIITLILLWNNNLGWQTNRPCEHIQKSRMNNMNEDLYRRTISTHTHNSHLLSSKMNWPVILYFF